MITDSKIASLKPGDYLSDPAPKGAGRLQVRTTAAGATVFYFRYTLPSGKRDTLPLGTYDAKGKRGMSLREARQKSADFSRLYQSGTKDIRGHLARTAKDAEAERDVAIQMARRVEHDAIEAARQVEDNATRTSLKALIHGYVESREIAGKLSTNQIRYTLKHYVLDAYPDLAVRKAASIKPSEFRTILATMIKGGVNTTTAKVRSYLHAAYRLALRAESDPLAPASLLNFGIEYNPIASIPALSELTGVGERSLTEKEFGAYFRELRAMAPSLVRTALLLAVLLGGQRMRQLLRVTAADVDLDGRTVENASGSRRHVKTVTLRDPKGRRKRPRVHILPIVGDAEALFDELLRSNDGESMLFAIKGQPKVTGRHISTGVREIYRKLREERISKSPFLFSDMRRTCETLMAGLGISKDIRAQIQSHGLGGVQARHYDRHDYLIEKHDALVKWAQAIAEFESRAATP